MRSYSVLFLLGAWLVACAAVQAQGPTLPGTATPPQPVLPPKEKKVAFWIKAPDSLEQHLAEALKNNPDIRVAEAKVREADAELNRTRMKVVSDVTFLQAEIQAAQAMVDYAKKQYERMSELHKANSIDERVYRESALALEKAKADLAAKQAKLPYLLGKQAYPVFVDLLGWHDDVQLELYRSLMLKTRQATKSATSDEDFLRRLMLDVQGRLPTPTEMKEFLKMPEKDRRDKWLEQHLVVPTPVYYWRSKLWDFGNAKTPDSPLNDKLRKALDAPITLKTGDIGQADLMEFVRANLKGVNLHVRAKSTKKAEVHVLLGEPIPLGAFLQFIEDELGCVFVLRDYGIVVTATDAPLPPGAIRVVDFWKHGKAPETKPETKEKK